jgi:O-antigen ligase
LSTSRSVINKISQITWAIFLIALPITSFPFFPSNIGGGTLVRPLSLYPLVILLVLVTLPRLFTKPLPRTFLTFFPFLLVAFTSSLLAVLQGIEALQGVSLIERVLRGLVTLGVGAAIYLTVSLWPKDREDLRRSLQWLYLGFGLALFWGSLQAIYVLHFNGHWFDILSNAQKLISTRKLFTNRISGMTYEPNWFADQISFLLLPWLLAAVISGYSVFRWRWKWITIELIMLIWSLALLPFTFSRAGLVVMIILVLLAVVLFQSKKRDPTQSMGRFRGLSLRRLLGIGAIIIALFGVIYLAGSRNDFFARIWGFWKDRQTRGVQTISDYFEYLGFGARFTYWETAYHVFEDHPIMGVGLGNYVFYFNEELPDQPLATMPEILRLIVPEEGASRLITAKNLYLRILAETGILGMATFLAFSLATIGCVIYLWLVPGKAESFWAIGGVLGLIAFFFVAFSFDSFAVPNFWVIFGFICAAASIAGKSLQPQQASSSS